MKGSDRILNTLEPLVESGLADAIEAVYLHRDCGLTRFCQNAIHQNLRSLDATLQLRVALDGRSGAFVTNRFDQDSLSHALTRAIEIAGQQPRDPGFKQLPRAKRVIDTHGYYESTGICTPEERALTVGRLVQACQKARAEAAGAMSNTTSEVAIANSRGTRSYQLSTSAEFNTVVSRKKLSGMGYWTGGDVYALPLERLIDETLAKVKTRRARATPEPGPYTVVLDHYAVGDMLSFLAYLGFGAKAHQEGRSCTVGKLGKRIADKRVTLWDDGQDPNGIIQAFDMEGVPKQEVILIKNGVCRRVVHDSRSAGREKGKRNTGHALVAPNSYGPLPTNLFMQGGDSSRDELIASVEQGVFVTKFHYTNVVEPMSTTITGMTKDGAFLIKNGRLANPVQNMRFTQSILAALNNVNGLSREARLVDGVLGPICVPALKLENFNFTGVSAL